MGTFTGLPGGTMLDGRYRVGSPIARGGMSMVYRGLDTRLDRPVAIKVMSPRYAADPAFLTRFEREARLAAGLGHPGVVAVYDYGRDDELVFLVMELVDGGTLRDLLRERRTLSVPETISVLDPLLAALGAAHAAGLVHRDVKPENVLISAAGAVKIADFGLVRAVSSQSMVSGDVILGTVAYLAPEQVATGKTDARSDVYAAGILAFEMLTGAPPIDGESPMSVAYQHVNSDVPAPSTRKADLPAELDRLVVNATRRDPNVRPRDASAFRLALLELRGRLGIHQVPVPVPRRPPVQRGAVPVHHAAPVHLRPGDVRQARPAGPDSTPGGGRSDAGSSAATRSAAPAAFQRPQPDTRTRVYPEPVDTDGDARGPTGTRVVGSARPLTVAEPVIREAVPNTNVPAERRPRGDPVAEQRRRRRRRWILGIVVVLLLGLLAAAGGWWLGGRWSATPPLVGLTVADAEAAVRDVGLVPRVSMSHDATVPAGQIARSDPVAGTRQLRGSPVDLVVSDGPEPVPVPEVAGKSVEDAENKLLVAGFAVGEPIRRFDARSERGSVLGSEPGAGVTTPYGSAVSLVVADFLTVPALRGAPVSDARRTLEQAGFTVTVGAPDFDAAVDADHVIRTDRDPGERVDPSDAQILVVPSNAVSVPDLDGYSVREARELAAQRGLEISVSALFGGDDATVLSQYPGPGDRIEPGGRMTVSAFP